MMRRHLLAVLTATSILGTASSAFAVAAPPCSPAVVRPRTAEIPANFPGFGYTALAATANDIHLKGPLGEVPLNVGPVSEGYLKVAPTVPLTVGAQYELQFQPFCWQSAYPNEPFKFTVTPEAPLPTKLGAFVGTPTFTTKDFGTTQVTFSASVTLEPELKPWLGAYDIGLVFDGKPIGTKISTSTARDSATLVGTGWCDEASAAKSTHTLLLRARLPFAPTLDTDVASLSFACPAPKITSAPNNPLPAPTTTPTSSSGGNPTSTVTTTSGGCSAAPGDATSSSWAFGLAFAVGAVIRRRFSRASR